MVFWRVLHISQSFISSDSNMAGLHFTDGRQARHHERHIWIDTVAIYMADALSAFVLDVCFETQFRMVCRGGFCSNSGIVETVLFPVYILRSRCLRWEVGLSVLEIRNTLQLVRILSSLRRQSVGMSGIVGFNSDYAFTVTNVIIHGVPYFALDLSVRNDQTREGNGVFIA